MQWFPNCIVSVICASCPSAPCMLGVILGVIAAVAAFVHGNAESQEVWEPPQEVNFKKINT